jgi:hypothetical protein
MNIKIAVSEVQNTCFVKEELAKLFLSVAVLDFIIQQGSELIDCWF